MGYRDTGYLGKKLSGYGIFWGKKLTGYGIFKKEIPGYQTSTTTTTNFSFFKRIK